MNLVVIIGSGAVGKMTVGQELMKITNYRLFHNHMMIEPVIDIFGRFNGAVVNKLRDTIFDEFMNTDYDGLIFTFMWAFDMPSDWEYIASVAAKFEATGGQVYYVELVADQAVRIERNKTENRLQNKASKRNLQLSQDRMLREETKYRLVSKEGEVPFPNYIKIDNTHLEPDVVARMIKERFRFHNKDARESMEAMRLDPVEFKELDSLRQMQIETFMPLFEKYQDEGSPATETLESIQRRAEQPDRQYYFIMYHGARAGVINVGRKGNDTEANCRYISPMFILPKYQNLGLGSVAMELLFQNNPDIKVWKLDTILEEERNLHFYEKCGFERVGDIVPVNERMHLVMYERRT